MDGGMNGWMDVYCEFYFCIFSITNVFCPPSLLLLVLLKVSSCYEAIFPALFLWAFVKKLETIFIIKDSV